MRNRTIFAMLLLTATSVGGCGLTVPDIKEPWDADKPPRENAPGVSGTAQIEFEIKKRNYCDLKEAVQAAYRIPLGEAHIPENWGAQLSLTLQVDETSSLNPGLTLNTTYPTVISYPAKAITSLGMLGATTTSQSFGLGFGATLSSTASRQDKFDPYYSIQTLRKVDTVRSICYGGPPYAANDPFLTDGWIPASSSPFIVESDLGIKEWLIGAMQFTNVLPSDVPQQQQKTPLPPQRSALPSGGGRQTGGKTDTGETPKKIPDTITL
jgi:hypothetical protein